MNPNKLHEEASMLTNELAVKQALIEQIRSATAGAEGIRDEFSKLIQVVKGGDGYHKDAGRAKIVLEKVDESEFGPGSIVALVERLLVYRPGYAFTNRGLSILEVDTDFRINKHNEGASALGVMVVPTFRPNGDISQFYRMGEPEVFGPGSVRDSRWFVAWPDSDLRKSVRYLEQVADEATSGLSAMRQPAFDTMGYLVERASNFELNPSIAKHIQAYYGELIDQAAENTA